MAKSTLNADGFDTGSNYHFGDKMLAPNFPRSLFDLSHLSSMTIKNAGYVFPISKWRTVPSDEFTISVRSLIRVMPQVVPLYSRQRLYIYAFYSRNGDLWENWNTFARKGLAGTTVKTIPSLNNNNTALSAPVAPDSLADYLDLPIGAPAAAVKSGKLSALPYMMYTRIWRDYFFNHNFAVKSESGSLVNSMQYLLPDNDDHFRLNDDGEIISFKENSVSTLFDLNDTGSLPYLDSDDKFHMGLFPHLYPDDYFTSALPFQQRGDAPVLNAGIHPRDVFQGVTMVTNAVGDWTSQSDLLRGHPLFNTSDFVGPTNSTTIDASRVTTNHIPFLANISSTSASSVYAGANQDFENWLISCFPTLARSAEDYPTGLSTGFRNLPPASKVLNVPIFLNDLRELTISQLELERMARTDGSYNEFAQTFFGVSPKNAIDYKPVYIGGTYTGLSFTEVLQTSSSSADSYLGQYAGHGIGADNDGYLGKIYCDDYGYIMILGCIMPDVYYHQGVARDYTELNQSQMLLPDRAKLGMQPILNQELYFQAYTVVDSDGNPVNENLFAYQDVFDDYRFMNNRIHGKIADIPYSGHTGSETFSPFTQARHFTALPNWSYEFAAATDVRKDYLAAPSEDAYSAQFAIDVRAVRPLPSQSVPLQFGV